MAGDAEEEADYKSDPEETKLSLKKRRKEASDGDDRLRDNNVGGRRRHTFGESKLWKSKDNMRRGHDKFEELNMKERQYDEQISTQNEVRKTSSAPQPHYALQNHFQGVHGTTIFAIKYKGGCIITMDSRGSNEVVTNRRRAANEARIPVFTLKDTFGKQYAISKHTMGVLAGNASDGFRLRKYMSETCQDVDPVSKVFDIATQYMNDIRDSKPILGTLIAGCDLQGSCSVYTVLIDKENMVDPSEDEDVLTLGTGGKYAIKRAHELSSKKEGGEFDHINLSYEEALEIAIECCFYGTLFDPSSGGPILAYEVVVDQECWRPVGEYDPLNLYTEKYDDLKEQNIIFLLVSTKNPHNTSILPALEKQFGGIDKVDASHRVCDILSEEDFGFHFHRIIFKTELAEQVLATIMNSPPTLIDSEETRKFNLLLKEFYSMNLPLSETRSVPVYVAPASKERLESLKRSREFIEPHERSSTPRG